MVYILLFLLHDPPFPQQLLLTNWINERSERESNIVFISINSFDSGYNSIIRFSPSLAACVVGLVWLLLVKILSLIKNWLNSETPIEEVPLLSPVLLILQLLLCYLKTQATLPQGTLLAHLNGDPKSKT